MSNYNKFLNSKSWKNFRNKYRKDKNYQCWICGSKKKKRLQLHHLSYQISLFDPINIIVLCDKHHYYLHFLTGKKEIHKNFNRVVSLKEGLKKMTIGEMKRLSIKIPIDIFEKGEMKEFALQQKVMSCL